MMKKRAFNPFALSSEKSLLVLFVQLLALLFVFSNQASAQWQKITSLPATNVHLMALDPSEPNHMWVGTEYNQFNPSGSGLYHSQNNGLSWMQLNSYTSQGISLAGTPVRSISIAPDNTVNSHFMLVSFANQGIFRSTDGGMSFTETQIPNLLSPGSFLKQNVSTVVVTRALGTTRKLYAVVDADEAAIGTAGLYSATISFPTQQILWQKAGYIQDRIKKLIVDPNNANNLFVVTYGSGVGSGSRLMKSIDGGQTFTNADSGLPMGTNATITDFAVSPTISTSMYASVFQSNVKGFYKSTNGGLSWTVVNNSEVFFRIVAASLNGVQGLYGIKDKSLIGSQPQYTVYQSQNDGLTWTELDTSFQAGGLTGKTLHFLEIHNGTIFVGGDDGVFSYGNGFGGGVQNGLTVTASANPQNVQPGGQVSVTLTVTNISQNVLSSVTVTGNSLPMGSVLSSFGAQECNLSSTQVYCSFSNLSPNVPITKTLTFTMPSTLGAGSSLTFTGNATTSFGQQLSGSSAPINLGGTGQGGISNGLTINASSSTANVQPNGQVNITLSVTNTSQSLLNTVTVTGNALPLGATLSSFGAQECNLFSTQVSCTFNNLSPNVPINKTLTFTMPSTLGAGSSLTFTGNATTSFGQQLSGSSAPINLGGTGQGGISNGLTINASSSTANVQPNGQVNITLSVTNTSQSFLNSVTVSGSSVPFGTTLNAFGSTGCNLVSTQVTCTFSNLSSNVAQMKTLTFTMPSNLGAGSSLTFTGNASSSTGQQLSGSSTAINLGGTGQGGVANGLTINASSSTANVQPNGQVSITLNVTNTSQSFLSSATVTGSSLPLGTTLNAFGSTGCNLVSTQVTCTFSNLSSNVAQTKTLTFTMPSNLGTGSSLTFNGSASSSTGQQLSGSSTPINLGGTGQGGQANGLAITATSSTISVQPNGLVNITLRVTNTSQSFLSSATVTGSSLPLGTTLSAFGSTGCNLVSTQVTCTFSNLSSNVAQTKTLTFTMPSNLGVGSSLTFSGNATSTTGQQLSGSSTPISLGGSSVGTGNVSFIVSPSILSVSPAQASTINFTVTNLSQVAISNASITSTAFPSGSFLGGGSNGCTLVSNIANCQIATLQPNATVNISLPVNMPSILPQGTIPAVTFSLNTGSGVPVTKAVSLSASGGTNNLLASSTTISVAASTPYLGQFTGSGVSTNTVYSLVGTPTKGIFKWSSPVCLNQQTCTTGGYSYTPNANAGGQTEYLQFSLRDNVTSLQSQGTITINITGGTGTANNSSSGAVGPWSLVLLLLPVLGRAFARRRLNGLNGNKQEIHQELEAA